MLVVKVVGRLFVGLCVCFVWLWFVCVIFGLCRLCVERNFDFLSLATSKIERAKILDIEALAKPKIEGSSVLGHEIFINPGS